MTILAIDLGKFKSVCCTYQAATGEHVFDTLPTTPAALHDLVAEASPERVVIEVGSAAGWVADLCEALGVAVQVADVRGEAWRWKGLKRKTDRDDALKLARLSAMNQLPTVTLPSSAVRQWRSLIAYRGSLVGRRTAIKNNLRAILDRQGLTHASGKSGWTALAVAVLEEQARPMAEVEPDELWRGMLWVELRALEGVEELLAVVEAKLQALADADARVALLRTIPGVGPRLAEAVVAIVDDPKRFRSGKQVGAYAGLVPRQFESGTMSRSGRITGRGNRLLRALLVEVSWLSRRHNAFLAGVFDRVCGGCKTRRKIAVVAVARRLLVMCWAMLRDNTPWRDPAPPPAPPPASPTPALAAGVG